MKRKIRVAQYGCGPIGCMVAGLALERPNLEVVGAIDIARDLVGKDLGQVIGLGRRVGITISDDAAEVLARAKPDVVLHTTVSSLEKAQPQISQIVSAGINVVSTCEELAYPWREQPEIARAIDELAKKVGVTVLATGVNPGFVMDTWPLNLTAVCKEVKKVRVARVQDATSRRAPFQMKIGAGLTVEEFQQKVRQGSLRHVGLSESIGMIAAGLGWELDGIKETLEPIIAKKEAKSQFVTIRPGQAAGVRQIGIGLKKGKEVIRLEFEASVGSRESYDAVYITGTPDLEMVVKGGFHGDIATAGIVVNAVRRALEAPPGLLTMKDIPLVTCFTG